MSRHATPVSLMERPSGQHLAPAGRGRALPPAVQAKVEGAFGHDLSRLRIQEGSHAESLGAVQCFGWTSLGRLNPRRYIPQAVGGYSAAQMTEPQNRLPAGPLSALGRLNPRRYAPRVLGGYSAPQMNELHNRFPVGPLDYLGPVNPRLYAPRALGGHSWRHLQERRLRDSFLPEALKVQLLGAHNVVANQAAKRTPRDVTLGEHHQTVSMLERIHSGHANLMIRPELARAEYASDEARRQTEEELTHGTMADLIRLTETAQGRGLLHSIAVREQDAGGRNRVFLNPYDVTLPPDAAPLMMGTPLADRQRVRVRYTPRAFKVADHVAMGEYGARAVHNPWEVPDRTDVSLFHELVHASHIQTGRFLAMDDLVTAANNPGADPVDLPAQGGRAVSREEYKTVGLGEFEHERWSDRNYRRERRALGENVPDRLYYTHKQADGSPWV